MTAIDPSTGTFNTQSIANLNAIKVGIKLMGNAQMNDYSVYPMIFDLAIARGTYLT